ncbi:Fur family transcriptional regulator [bacterium BRH_c32]|nr:MAG: Fur family transcriptional regulator [bacterium BRH_c32]
MNSQKAKEEFNKFLKQGKYRITPERFEVLESALNFDEHFGADELYIKMKSEKSRISRATVYNTLELLIRCGLLCKRNFGENKTRYESNYDRKNHDHLICSKCGTITEFSSPKIQKIVSEISLQKGFAITGYSLNIHGNCIDNPDCTKK